MKITLDFGGGADVLFDHIKKRELTLDSDKKCKKHELTAELKFQKIE